MNRFIFVFIFAAISRVLRGDAIRDRAFATLLTGQRYYFAADGSTASDGRLAEIKDREAREKGDIPWES